MKWLSGKKTYIVAGLGLLGALGALIAGEVTWLEFLGSAQLSALGAAIRHGVSKDSL